MALLRTKEKEGVREGVRGVQDLGLRALALRALGPRDLPTMVFLHAEKECISGPVCHGIRNIVPEYVAEFGAVLQRFARMISCAFVCSGCRT